MNLLNILGSASWHWWENNVLRMSGLTQFFVVVPMFIISFWLIKQMFKKSKLSEVDSFAKFRWLYFVFAALIFAFAMWIVTYN